jgi:NADH-ubiquinone oxidoreductase chain 6
MTSLLILIISSIAINIFIIINPLSIGISILLIALTVATIFSYTISSWISFLIFLIYIRGILVIFSYFVSLTPNQSTNLLSIIIILISTFITLFFLTIIFNITTLSAPFYHIQSNTFYLKSNTATLILLALILLFTIIIVVKLTTNIKGPLRPFTNKYV